MNLESYNNLIEKISKKFSLEFEELEAIYNFDIGDELEIAICKVLRKFLPLKYGVVRGFVVDKDGNKEGDDIIIFDQHGYPTLRFLNNDDLSQKQQVPIEAVYAYIEVKNTLKEEDYQKAIEQVKNVKMLCYKRKLKMFEWLPYEENNLFSNKYSDSGILEPTITNPVYGMIFSRYSVDDDGKKVEKTNMQNIDKVNTYANKMLQKYKDKIEENKFLNPDSIIFGNSNIAICSGKYMDNKGKEKLGITKFYAGIKCESAYQVQKHKNNSYGIALAHLMMALNFIKLNEMPWESIFGCSKYGYADFGRFVDIYITDLDIKE